MLLEDIRALFAERGVERLSSADVVRSLGGMEDRPWAEWRAGNAITVRQLAKLLEPFKVAPTKFRAAGYTPGTRGYELAAFADAFARYLPKYPPPSATTPHINESAISETIDAPHRGSSVADGIPPKATEALGCGVVADGEPDAEDLRAAFEERAAIREYDGGFDREEAEALAAVDLGLGEAAHG